MTEKDKDIESIEKIIGIDQDQGDGYEFTFKNPDGSYQQPTLLQEYQMRQRKSSRPANLSQ